MTQPILLFQLETGCGAAGICSCLSNVHSLFLLSKQKSDESWLAGTRPSRPTALCQWCVQGRKSGSRDVKDKFCRLVSGKDLLLGYRARARPCTDCLPLPCSTHMHSLPWTRSEDVVLRAGASTWWPRGNEEEVAEGRMEQVVFLMTLLSCSISRGVTYFRFLHQQIINVIRLAFLKKYKALYLFLAVLGLCCCGAPL